MIISKDHILIETTQRDKSVFDAYRLNAKTGNIEMIAENPGYFVDWMIDHKGLLRLATSIDGTDSSIYYRGTEKEKFQKIITTGFKDEFSPIMFSFDNQNLYVRSNLKRDKMAIELFDPKQKKTLSTLFVHPDVDVLAHLSYSKKEKDSFSCQIYNMERLRLIFLILHSNRLFMIYNQKFQKKKLILFLKIEKKIYLLLRLTVISVLAPITSIM